MFFPAPDSVKYPTSVPATQWTVPTDPSLHVAELISTGRETNRLLAAVLHALSHGHASDCAVRNALADTAERLERLERQVAELRERL